MNVSMLYAHTIVHGPIFRIAGTCSFSDTGYINPSNITWRVNQSLVPEQGGSTLFAATIFSAAGIQATFNLQKSAGYITRYSIIAEEQGIADSLTVQVVNAGEISRFIYEGPNNLGKPINIYSVVPATLSSSTHFVVVMHGTNRDANVYITSWQLYSNAHNYISVAPEISATYWPNSSGYHLGNMFTREDTLGSSIPENQWTFSLVEELAQYLMKGFGISDTLYDLWGHSAGGQFVHRFMLFKPECHVRLAIAANPGYYTTPDFNVPYPCGLKYSKVEITPSNLQYYTERPLVIMRGTADTVRDSELNTGGFYDAQGLNRYQRAGNFYSEGFSINQNTTWKLLDVLNSGHSQATMAPGGQEVFLDTSAPSSPELQSPADGSMNEAIPTVLQWSKPQRALMFHVQVSTQSSFAGFVVDDSLISDDTYSAKTLSKQTLYYWRVKARNYIGESNWSTTRSFNTSQTINHPLFTENFGNTVVLANGWSISNGGWVASTSNSSAGYDGASGGTNLAASNSGTATDCSLTVSHSISTIGVNEVSVLWAARRSLSFTNAMTFEWSADGTQWNQVPYNEVPNTTTWQLVNNSIPISLGAAACNVSNLRLRWRFSQANNGGVYRIDDVVLSENITTGVAAASQNVPTTWSCDPVFPNPFNLSTTLRISVLTQSQLKGNIYDVCGRQVWTFLDNNMRPGKYFVSIHFDGLTSGIYLYRLYGEGISKTGKMVLLK